MRMMMRVSIPVEAGNEAIKDGSLGTTFQKFMDSAKPEAAYFVAGGGERAAYFFLEMKEPSQLPSIAEPFFSTLRASIDITPAMNIGDVRAGLSALKS